VKKLRLDIKGFGEIMQQNKTSKKKKLAVKQAENRGIFECMFDTCVNLSFFNKFI